MAKKVKFNYFEAFEQQVDVAEEEAEVLIEAIEKFDGAENLLPLLHKAHEIERRGDEINHHILKNVDIDFITPIERADIIDLAQDIDDVTDMVEGVIQRIFMFNIKQMEPEATEFAHIIMKSIKALRKSMGTFRDFKKIKKINAMVEDVNQLEEHADELYVRTIRGLYAEESPDMMHTIVWTFLFDRLESTVDACEIVADTMATIALKNN